MEEIYDIRRKNLQFYCKHQFDDDRGRLYKKITDTGYDFSTSTLNKLLAETSSPSHQVMKEEKARELESVLGLNWGYFDSIPDKKFQTYYVTLKVGGSRTYDLAKQIYDMELPVVECSSVLGDFDLLLKVEVSEDHELEKVLDKLTRFPGVLRTRTYYAVDSLRWQRQQFEVPVSRMIDPADRNNYAEKFRHKRILNHLEAIKKVSGDELQCNHAILEEIVNLTEVMKEAKKSFMAVRLHDEPIENKENYLQAEDSFIQKGGVSKRLFTLPKTWIQEDCKEFEDFLDQARKLIAIGCDLKFVFYEHWIKTESSKLPECFAIVDEDFVYLRKNNAESLIYLNIGRVKQYQEAFENNWGQRAITMDDLISLKATSLIKKSILT